MPPHAWSWRHPHEGTSLVPLGWGDLGKLLGRAWKLSWRRGGKQRDGKKRDNYRGRRGRSEAEVRRCQQKCWELGRWEGSLGATIQAASAGRRGLSTGTRGNMCRAREGTQRPPYHQIGELPLLTRFPSWPGEPWGAADNTNQSCSDYGTLE